MHTIALVTQKGGSGKTTLAVTLAVAAAEAGEKVVALDLDPQASLIAWGNERANESPAVDALTGDKVAQLPQILKKLESAGYTVAVLDCPGVASTAVTQAMKAADLCLVPTRPTKIDMKACLPTIHSLMAMARPFAFILNQCPAVGKGRSNEAVQGLRMFGIVADPMIISRADYQDAVAAGLGVTEYAHASKAAEEARGLWAWVSRTLKGQKPNV